MTPPTPRHFLRITDLQPAELESVLALAAQLKSNPSAAASALAGSGLAYYAEKPSTRTKLSFQAAVASLGGHFLEMSGSHLGNGKEDVADTARTISRYASYFAARVYSQAILEEFAQHSSIPVINALSDEEHPCQALADLQTILEARGRNTAIAFVGDGNNVCTSLALGACMLGFSVKVASPAGYELDSKVQKHCSQFSGSLFLTDSPKEAVEGADVVYTDVWMSMGDEAQAKERREAFAGYQVDSALMSLATPNAVFMHCLPAKKGEEVTEEVFESPQSIVFSQAENRLHAQKALLLLLQKPSLGG